jgi:hypothetical protein
MSIAKKKVLSIFDHKGEQTDAKYGEDVVQEELPKNPYENLDISIEELQKSLMVKDTNIAA